jgi:hypothetical protein
VILRLVSPPESNQSTYINLSFLPEDLDPLQEESHSFLYTCQNACLKSALEAGYWKYQNLFTLRIQGIQNALPPKKTAT